MADDDPAAVFEFDNHFLGEDFQSQDPALTMVGDHSRADGRQLVLESLVGVKLVTQTAFQPTTTSRDFRGVERGFLNFCHPHRDRGHPREVRVAADGLAAVAVIGQELGLVADPDLAHLDPRLEGAGQVLDQLAEVDPLLGEVIEDHPLAAPGSPRRRPGPSGGDAGRSHSRQVANPAFWISVSFASRARSSVEGVRRISPAPLFWRYRAVRSLAGQRTSPSSVPRSVCTTTR